MSYDPRRGSSNYLGMSMDNTSASEPQKPARKTAVRSSSSSSRLRTKKTSAKSVDKTMVSSPVVVRDASTVSRRKKPVPAPSRQAAPAPRPAPSPQQRPYGERPSSGAKASLPSVLTDPIVAAQVFFLNLLAVVLRAIAIALAALVVASAFLSGSARIALLEALRLTPLVVPPALLGRFVYETPFGGVVRGDFAIVSIILFCSDYVCVRFSTSLRERRERGA